MTAQAIRRFFRGVAVLLFIGAATSCATPAVVLPDLSFERELFVSLHQSAVAEAQAGSTELYRLGLAARDRGDLVFALDCFSGAASLEPAWALPHLEAAVLHPIVDNDLGKALGHARTAVSCAPDNPRAHTVLGRLLLDQGLCAEAVGVLDSGIRLRGADSGFHYLLGRAALCAGDVPLAEREFTYVTEQQRDNASAYLELARLYEQQGALPAAEQTYAKLLTRLGRQPVFVAQLLAFYRRNGMEAKAIAAEAELKRKDPQKKQGRKLRPLQPSKR